MTAQLKGFEAGSTKWAEGDPPAVRGPWEDAIIELVQRGDSRFVPILLEHVRCGRIKNDRAREALGMEAA